MEFERYLEMGTVRRTGKSSQPEKMISESITELPKANVELQQETTERKIVGQALRESEDKFRALFEFAPDPYYLSDLEGNFIDGNRAAENLLGYKREELIGKNFLELDLLSEKELKKATELLAKNMAGKATGPDEFIIKRKDGRDVTVGIRTVPINIGGQGIVLGIARDVSELKRAEKAFKERELQYRGLFENTGTATFVTEEDMTISQINVKCEELTGYSRDEIEGKMKTTDFIPVEELERIKKYHIGRRKKDSDIPSGYELDFVDKKGSIKNALIQVGMIPGTKQSIASIINITPLKQTERSLRESEEKYRLLFENANDAIFVAQDQSIKLSNPRTSEIIGYSEEDLLKMSFVDIIHPEDREAVIDRQIRRLSGERRLPTTYSFKIINKAGDNILIELSAVTITWEGRPATLNFARDITQLKKLEDQLQQAQKMESMGTLAGGIAHDFNNILVPMFGYLEMMLQDVPEDNPLHSHLAEVFNGAKRARDLVQQILSFGRQKDHELKPLKVHPVIKEALKLIKSSLPSTIEISQNIKTDCGLVMADLTQIHQIVMNLCTNAFHAMEETDGKLTITLKEVELSAEDLKDPAMIPGPHVCLTVADTGPGMEQGIIARIFDPYFTTKEEGKGTGLGLAVVHGIVKSYGGHISVYSELGKGTEFKVYLPVIKPQETAQIIEADLPIQKGNERILLIDDQDVIVQMIRQMLERLGYHVTARASSTDALEAFRTQPDKFDLVITDMTMPNMTGDKLAGELIKIRSDIPVILCTGFSEIMSKEKAAAMGIKGFLMKPVVIKDLSGMIRKVLDQS